MTPATIDSETLYRDYARFVAAFLYRLGAHTSEVEDLVQDVFLAAHRKGGYVRGSASAATFLGRLALEAKLGKRRRDRRFQTAQSADTALALVSQAQDDPSAMVDRKRMAARLQAALDAIEPNRRALFILFELHGESCETIGAAFDLKLGTVYSRLHAAREQFKAHLKQQSSQDWARWSEQESS